VSILWTTPLLAGDIDLHSLGIVEETPVLRSELRQFHLEVSMGSRWTTHSETKMPGRRGKKDVGQSLPSIGAGEKRRLRKEAWQKQRWWGATKVSSPAATAPSRPARTTERRVLKSLRQRHRQRTVGDPARDQDTFDDVNDAVGTALSALVTLLPLTAIGGLR
jgi:hypothetical protein